MQIAEQLFLEGVSLREIERQTGINRKKLSLILKEKGYRIDARTGNSGYDKTPLYRKGEELYQQGMSIKSISKQLKICEKSLSLWLKERDYIIVSSQQPNLEKQIQFKKKLQEGELLFLHGVPRTKICKLLSLDATKFIQYLTRKGYSSNQNGKKYTYNENIFKIIDSEEKAYWLGFLYADGSVTSGDRYVLEVTLQKGDKRHLEKLKTFLNTDVPIKNKTIHLNNKTYLANVIHIYNKKIVSDLIDLGCTPKKSLTINFPDETIVPKELQHHFIRGYIDGDGSITNKYRSCMIEILGTKEFLSELIKRWNLPIKTFRTHGKAYGYLINKKEYTIPFLTKVYANATIYLDRKYQKVIKFFELNKQTYKPNNNEIDGTPNEGKLSRSV
ncbi:hypothetical protein M3685_12635 [Heyndrickxia oleronia]|uniref:WhiA LAGLIDADG-like domain-containing protein n=1 Tax=Heyndrickxia oleronia TaxID=38875 RepID=A0AAW6SYN7_9BACI|nr:hypothetical protein [Heyndrickxia oleronia]MCM3240719.1 hypothetical protein [Heyndrickxia oleronia]MCM3454768.1 hypothetical protein [Heyndrickxia oleronia]MDH5163333.1 hypothetical protein [Heyndrickxia oleronia]NYV66517.1 hypothetical protein [Bacillus sp. Gen3]